MLVQHHLTSRTDYYRLPGGGVNYREKLEDCVVREIREETGLNVKTEHLLWVRDFLEQFSGHSVEFFFLATILGGEFKPTRESDGSHFLFMKLEDLENVVFYPKEFLQKLKKVRADRNWVDENPYIRSVN
jgi:ADP-ribose pyrophosphatase YjhB (NUDIX family)